MNDDGGESIAIVDAPYLLALNIPLVRTPDGRYFADPSWAKDLLLHPAYLPRLILACPYIRQAAPEPGWTEVAGVTVRGWRTVRRGAGQYLAMVGMIARLLAEVPRARVVHCGIAGFPFPAGWVAVPLARLLGRRIVIVVESAFWRVPHGEAVDGSRRRKAALWEAMNRFCLRQADYAAYSQDDYRRTLPAPRAGGGALFQASWIDEGVVLPVEAIATRQSMRGGPGRFLFASRMIAEKGTAIVAEALRLLAGRAAQVHIDIIGDGPELDGLRSAAGTDWGRAHVRVLDQVPYGPAFFELLGGYDAVLVPSLSDEQPRIIYDAYSQGVSTIAADTPGTRACVRDGETGMLIPPGDASALAEALVEATRDPAALRRMGRAGRDLAAANTHAGMHRQRAAGIARMLQGR
ncbi:hypothetical protein GCM10011380_04110 [Sphingomonas metalli]|uniref:Glycosyltransferase n=1 Tax=Sphingomonas metalli TaxID=1779358 RepID=A0A916STW1_9SPHN|nr:glycosyltransferase [Sphingomonas metalli]GGB17758.1 hypothetical protein GCM10011380_04110 [Sphingomonas metalli]